MSDGSGLSRGSGGSGGSGGDSESGGREFFCFLLDLRDWVELRWWRRSGGDRESTVRLGLR